MPIVSFSVSEHIKNYLKKMAKMDQYKSSSGVIRAALVKMMDDAALPLAEDLQSELALGAQKTYVTGTVMIGLPHPTSDHLDDYLKSEKRLVKLEAQYAAQIKHKTTVIHNDLQTVLYVIDAEPDVMQEIIVEFNSIDSLLSLRYAINAED
jgi:Arc/MetJ-type ribon-helix-helix transcriptional regulator